MVVVVVEVYKLNSFDPSINSFDPSIHGLKGVRFSNQTVERVNIKYLVSNMAFQIQIFDTSVVATTRVAGGVTHSASSA